MGHLAIVNSTTIQSLNSRPPYISTSGIIGDNWHKTLADLLLFLLG